MSFEDIGVRILAGRDDGYGKRGLPMSSEPTMLAKFIDVLVKLPLRVLRRSLLSRPSLRLSSAQACCLALLHKGDRFWIPEP